MFCKKMIQIPRDISRELQSMVDRELEPGESVKWIGMPIPRFFTGASTGSFLFAIPWTAFAIFWMFGAWHQSENVPFTLFGVPFVLIGFGILSVPLFTYRRSFKTVYVITDKRAITFTGGGSTTVRSYPPDTLREIYRKERKDGTGDVVISRRAWRDSDGDRQSEELGFLRVDSPKEIEHMLKYLAEQAAPSNR
jgi:hypothetical protein